MLMSIRATVLVALCAVLAAVSSQAHERVTELTTASFDRTAAGNKVLLELYATWCTHCRKFEASYGRVAETLAADGITVARADGSANRFLSMRFKVTGFPSFYYMEDGRVWEYRGDRTVDALIAFARSKGETYGKEMTGMSAPFSLYWKLSSSVADTVDQVANLVHDHKPSAPVLIALVFACLALVVLSFLILIHYITKPQPRPKQN
jgi:thiol-disulfide isomerase/thioredoxin